MPISPLTSRRPSGDASREARDVRPPTVEEGIDGLPAAGRRRLAGPNRERRVLTGAARGERPPTDGRTRFGAGSWPTG
jgi:hypothetical protein